MPRITIVLPSRNHARYLREAIDCILDQTYADFELIIWDDASTDHSWEIIKSYQDPRIQIFRNEKQQYGIFINKVIREMSQGEYIAVATSDDIWESDKLEKQIEFLDRHDEIGAVFTKAAIIDDDGIEIHDENIAYVRIFNQENKTRHEWLRHFICHGNALCHPSVLIRKSCYFACGFYRAGLAQFGDYDMWVRLCMKYQIFILDERLVRFRIHHDNSNASAVKPDSARRMKFEYPLVLENYRHIRDVGDLLRIFPEAREYCGHPDADPDFVLAMSILKFSCNASAKSFAKRILFELISNPSRAEKIESIHNFSIVNFVEITGQDDAAPYVECSSLQAGIAAFSNEDFATAISLFTALLETEPTNPLPPAYLAFIAARQEDAKAAADFIEISGRLAPERADLKAALGESFLKAGNPALAARYLEEAISARPDLLDAYPAYAQSLHLTGQSEAAVALLQSAAGIASPTQAAIRNVLLEILIQRGDLDEFTRACLRFSRGLADDLLAARCLSRFDPEGEHLLETLGHVQRQLADACTDETDKPAGKRRTPGTPLRIAFLAGDFAQEERLQRLPALLRHLPAERFRTFLFTSDPHGDCANFCALLADRVLPIHAMHDADVLQAIHAAAPDILIDLDAYGPTERLTVFLQAEVPEKFLWGEAPMPPLSPRCRVLTGARLADAESFAALPHATLPEMGEYCDLPDLPMETPSRPAEKPARLACLTPAMRIGREGWRLFAEVLKMCPASALRLNLQYLGDAARDFIRAEFARAGVAAERLDFVRAHTPKDLCRFWREVDLGLAPPTDAGDPALPACLWMGRPYLALASPLPWSRRPAALLELAGAREWIAQTPEDYINRAQQLPIAPNPDFRARMEKAGMNNPQIFAQGFAESMTALFAR